MLNWRCGLGIGRWCCAALSRPCGPSAATAAASSVMYIQACPTACAVEPRTLLLGGAWLTPPPGVCCTALSSPPPVVSRHVHLVIVIVRWSVLLSCRDYCFMISGRAASCKWCNHRQLLPMAWLQNSHGVENKAGTSESCIIPIHGIGVLTDWWMNTIRWKDWQLGMC